MTARYVRYPDYHPTPEQIAAWRQNSKARHQRERDAERAALEACPRTALSRQRRHGCAFATCTTSVGPDDLLCPLHAADVLPADLTVIKVLWFEGSVASYLAYRDRVMYELHTRHGVRIEQASTASSRTT